MKFSNLFHVAACGVAVLALSATARADSGYAWVVSDTNAQSATYATLSSLNDQPGSSSNADVTFNVTGGLGSVLFNPSDSSSNYTFGTFLGAGSGASGVIYKNNGNDVPSLPTVSGSTAIGGSYTYDTGGFTYNQTTHQLVANTATQDYGTLFEITGTGTSLAGDTLSIVHDDGVSLYLNGNNTVNVLSGDSGPTSADPSAPSTYTFASNFSGTYELIYGECCGAPATLTITASSATPTPEPASILLFGSLLGIGTMTYRKRSKKA